MRVQQQLFSASNDRSILCDTLKCPDLFMGALHSYIGFHVYATGWHANSKFCACFNDSVRIERSRSISTEMKIQMKSTEK